MQADVIRAQARGPITTRPNCPHWDIEAASLFIQGSKVTSDMKNQLTSQMHDNNMRSFLIQKESWSSQTFDAINWHSSERELLAHRLNTCQVLWRRTHMLFLPGNQSNPQLSVTGCDLPPRRIMVKSQEGHANVETSCRLLYSY
jgi:hypothetical protein